MAKAMTEDQKESPQKTNAMFVVNMVTGHRNVPEEMVMVWLVVDALNVEKEVISPENATLEEDHRLILGVDLDQGQEVTRDQGHARDQILVPDRGQSQSQNQNHTRKMESVETNRIPVRTLSPDRAPGREAIRNVRIRIVKRRADRTQGQEDHILKSVIEVLLKLNSSVYEFIFVDKVYGGRLLFVLLHVH